MDNTVITKSL